MKVKIGVFFGGKSVEHEISIISALQAIYAVDSSKYQVVPIYISKNGFMYTSDKLLDIKNYSDIDSLLEKCIRIVPVQEKEKLLLIRYPSKPFAKAIIDSIDVAFPIVHGTNVEDGTLQGFIQSLSCPFVGCDVLSSAVGMDKAMQKSVLKNASIPVLDCITISRRDFYTSQEHIISNIENNISYPMIVKPVNLGSSIGIKKAEDQKDLIDAFEYAFEFSDKILIERAIFPLREINCSVLGDEDDVQASECEEPINQSSILGYAEKYLQGEGKNSKNNKISTDSNCSKTGIDAGMSTSKRKLPADISPELKQKVQTLAKETFLALGCCGVSRIDFLYQPETEELYVNEINTIPGSLSFYLWEATGISFSELIDRLISLAFKRERRKQKLTYSFETNILKGFAGENSIKNSTGCKN